MKTRSGLGLLVLVVLCLFAGASDAYAIFYNDVNDPCPTYDDCTLSGPTETGGPLKDPFMVTCFATKLLKQGCRSCVQNYDDQGQPFEIVCGYVERNGGCTCEGRNATCKAMGSCEYFTQ